MPVTRSKKRSASSVSKDTKRRRISQENEYIDNLLNFYNSQKTDNIFEIGGSDDFWSLDTEEMFNSSDDYDSESSATPEPTSPIVTPSAGSLNLDLLEAPETKEPESSLEDFIEYEDDADLDETVPDVNMRKISLNYRRHSRVNLALTDVVPQMEQQQQQHSVNINNSQILAQIGGLLEDLGDLFANRHTLPGVNTKRSIVPSGGAFNSNDCI